MKAKRVAAGLLACLMLLTMAGCGGDSSETEAAAQQEQDMGTAVETQTVTRTDLSNENMVSGQIIADTLGFGCADYWRHGQEPAGQGGRHGPKGPAFVPD